MNLPPEFISTIQNTFGDTGRAFLKALPDMVVEASARWELTDVQPVPMLSYNFVAFARRGVAEVVLKMGTTNSEMDSELAALRLFNGEGICKLLAYDEQRYWMLLERLKPGAMLAMMEDDEEATRIAAEVMKRIWRNVGFDAPFANAQDVSTSDSPFIQLTDWFDGLKRLRKMFNGGTGPLSAKLVEHVESSVKDLFAENHDPVLMHGDFHHFNILSSERGWLVIDPKGVIGPAGYEVGPLMMNPWGSMSDGVSRRLILRRIDILHEHLGFERERIREWSLAHALLSAWWGIEDNTGWEYAMQFAELLASL